MHSTNKLQKAPVSDRMPLRLQGKQDWKLGQARTKQTQCHFIDPGSLAAFPLLRIAAFELKNLVDFELSYGNL